jgi:hypothetical protein
VIVDGTSLGQFGSSPFTATWDATGLPAGPHTLKAIATDAAGNQAEVTSVAVVVATNRPPVVSLATSGTCGTGCSVTFAATASDPDGDALTRAWSGCATGTADSAICSRSSAGSLNATITVADAPGQTASASASVPVYASAYSTSSWSACTGAGAYTCTAAGPTGCARPGTQVRTVAESAWTLDAAQAVSAPATNMSCTETTEGYVASYTSAYDANWTCTASGANGCFKNRVSFAPATFSATGPSVPAPAAKIYTTGYVASWSVGSWSGCSASCGGGWQTRTVYANGWKATAPDAGMPSSGQGCNDSPCRLTCGDYGLYSTWGECYGDGWPYCDTRYRDDGIGGLLTCRHGYN